MFLLVAPQSAHTPLEAPDEYLDMFTGIHDHNRRVFSAMVAAMDVMVGRVIQALRESNLYENSLVVFVSDNGAATMQALLAFYILFRLPFKTLSGRKQLASERREGNCLGGG